MFSPFPAPLNTSLISYFFLPDYLRNNMFIINISEKLKWQSNSTYQIFAFLFPLRELLFDFYYTFILLLITHFNLVKKLDPYGWLKEVLHWIAEHPVNKVTALLPHRYKKWLGRQRCSLSDAYVGVDAFLSKVENEERLLSRKHLASIAAYLNVCLGGFGV